MKLFISIAILIITTLKISAQAPEKISYQAIIRDTNNLLITNQTVGIRLGIYRNSVNGTKVYEETQTSTSNGNGLVSLQIGSGNIVFGAFASIDWSNGPYFLKREIDLTGGTNYSINGSTELLSVPYSLYATNSESSKYVKNQVGTSYTSHFMFAGNSSNVTISSTNQTWEGNRRIILNGYVKVEFNFAAAASTYSIDMGTANLTMYLKYDGQVIMPIEYRKMPILKYSYFSIPFSTIIPFSTSGNSKQFTIEGIDNTSKTNTGIDPFTSTIVGPFPIDVDVTTVFTWMEL